MTTTGSAEGELLVYRSSAPDDEPTAVSVAALILNCVPPRLISNQDSAVDNPQAPLQRDSVRQRPQRQEYRRPSTRQATCSLVTLAESLQGQVVVVAATVLHGKGLQKSLC